MPALIDLLRRRLRWVLATFALAMAAATVVTFTLPELYRTTSLVLVQPLRVPPSAYEATELAATLNVTYAELLDSRNVAARVARALPDELARDLSSRTSVEIREGTRLLEIEAEGSSPGAAKVIADTYAETAAGAADELVDRDIARATVSVASRAPLPTSPSRPQPWLYLSLAAVVAALLVVAVALLRSRLDRRLDVSLATTELFGLPVIGRVPHRPRRRIPEDGLAGDRVLTEAFELVLANLAFTNRGRRPKTLAVLSAMPGEGRTTAALALGRAAAQLGIATLLVDGDLRGGDLSRTAAGPEPPSAAGLSSFLVRPRMRLGDGVVGLGTSLHLAPSGPVPPNPSALLATPALRAFDRRARRAHDFVVYDTPPLAPAADASLIASAAEAAILVVDVRRGGSRAVLGALEQLRRSGTNVLGVVINHVGEQDVGSYGYAYAGAAGEPARA